MCWVIPPASPGGHLGLADRVEQRGLAVVHVAHDGDHGRPVHEVFLDVVEDRRPGPASSAACVDLDPLVEGVGQHLDRLVRERLRERGHLPELHQLLDDLGRRELERLRHLLDGRAGLNRYGRLLARRVARRRQRLEVGLHPLRPAAPSAAAARGLLRWRRLAIAARRLRVDDHASPAPAATAAAAGLAAAGRPRRARALTAAVALQRAVGLGGTVRRLN